MEFREMRRKRQQLSGKRALAERRLILIRLAIHVASNITFLTIDETAIARLNIIDNSLYGTSHPLIWSEVLRFSCLSLRVVGSVGLVQYYLSSTTSQWPPLSPPIRLTTPFFFRFLM